MLLTPGARGFAAGPELSADALAKQLSHYADVIHLEADFSQVKELKELGLRLPAKGHFSLTRENGKTEVSWRLLSPQFLALEITESRLLLFESPEQKEGKPLLEGEELQAKVLRPLYAWLTMDAARIANQYKVFSGGSAAYRLEPRDAAGPVRSIQLHLGGDGFVDKLILEERSGDALKIDFAKTKAERGP